MSDKDLLVGYLCMYMREGIVLDVSILEVATAPSPSSSKTMSGADEVVRRARRRRRLCVCLAIVGDFESPTKTIDSWESADFR